MTGPDQSWVVFEHGTCVVLTEPQGDLAAQATALLCDWVPQIGSSKADFSVAELENGHGWVITCAHPDILNFIARNDAGPETGDAVIGMVGRSKRQQDAQEPRVIHVEDRRQPGVAVGVETAGADDAPAPVSATSVGEGDLKDE